MRALLVGIGLVALAIGSGCTSNQARREANQGVAVHACSKNPLLRSVGLFGGEQPDIFLTGQDLRREPSPVADGSTRVLNVTEIDYLRDPSAQPVIDRCGSRLQSTGEREIEVTILWEDRNCPHSFDQEDPEDCHSRARFGFSPEQLGIQEALDGGEDPNAALQRLLVVDAYFTREIQTEGRHSATGVLAVPRSDVYLVVRVIPAESTVDPQAVTTGDASCESGRRS